MKLKQFITGLFLTLSIFSFSQERHSNLDLIVSYQYQKSKKLLFINGIDGAIISTVEFNEPLWFVASNKEDDVFHAQTKHYIYKGKISTGEILDSFKVFENQETIGALDLNIHITPIGITNQGEALYFHHEELINATRNMLLAKGMKVMKASKKYSEVVLAPKPIFKIDLTNKTKELYKEVTLGLSNPYTLSEDGSLWAYNQRKNMVTKTNYKTDEKLNEYDLVEAVERDPILSKFTAPENAPTPSTMNGDLFSVIIHNVNQEFPMLMENYIALCSKSKRRVLSKFKGNLHMSPFYPVSYSNCETLVYGKTTSSFNQPQPVQPATPTFGAFGAKKKLKEFNAKIAVYGEDIKHWYEGKSSPKNNNVTLYKDSGLTQEIKMFKGVQKVHVYNNNMVLLEKANEIVLFDIDTNTEKWVINF